MEPRLIALRGQRRHWAYVLEASSEPAIVLVHGFPDGPQSFFPLMRRLHQSGYTVVAPYLRGQAPDAPPAPQHMQIAELGADVLDVLSALGRKTGVLIGHDWGAPAVYAAAALAPERVRLLVGMSVPPLRVLLRNMRRSPGQLRRSSYILFFQLPWVPEQLMRRTRAAFVRHLWRAWSPGWMIPDERVEAVSRQLVQPQHLESALSLYRGALRGQLLPARRMRDSRRLVQGRLAPPALIITGQEDQCISVEMFRDIRNGFAGPVTFTALPGVGHFVPAEAPDAVATLVLRELQASRGESATVSMLAH